MTFQTALVVGSGFLGSHVLSALQKKCPDVKLYTLDARKVEDELANVHYLQGDLTSYDDVQNALEVSRPDVIIHTASPLPNSPKDVLFKVNVEGTRTLIQIAKSLNTKALVYTSSAGVVFDGNDVINATEKVAVPEKLSDSYNESKLEAERVVLAENGPTFKTCALRVAGLFGPGDRQLIPGMINVIRNKQTRFQLGNNDNLFDFTFVGNAADAHVLAAEALLSKPTNAAAPTADGKAFFITNGEPVYFWDFARAIWAHYGDFPSFIIKIPMPLAMVVGFIGEWSSWLLGKEPGITRQKVVYSCVHRYFTINLAKTILNYQPKVPLDEGLRQTLKWFDEQGYKP